MSSSTFRPPKLTIPEWASYIENRYPKFKVHTSRGHAYNAIMIEMQYGRPRGGILYRLVNGDWQEDFRYEQDRSCIVCGEEVHSRQGGWQDRRPEQPRHERRLVHDPGYSTRGDIPNCRAIDRARQAEAFEG